MSGEPGSFRFYVELDLPEESSEAAMEVLTELLEQLVAFSEIESAAIVSVERVAALRRPDVEA